MENLPERPVVSKDDESAAKKRREIREQLFKGSDSSKELTEKAPNTEKTYREKESQSIIDESGRIIRKNFKETQSSFESAWSKLSDDEKKIMTYVHYHFSGEEQHKLPNQDELEKSANKKLSQAGIDIKNLEKYLEKEK